MQNFGWKRKRNVLTTSFNLEDFAYKEKQRSLALQKVKKPTIADGHVADEDTAAVVLQLKEAGSSLAEAGKFSLALDKWNAALRLNDCEETIMEMKAQVLMEIGENEAALQSSKNATRANPNWFLGWQTSGRAFLNVGQVGKARLCFCRAVHLCPSDDSCWSDLSWAHQLFDHHRRLNSEFETGAEVSASVVTSLPPAKTSTCRVLSSQKHSIHFSEIVSDHLGDDNSDEDETNSDEDEPKPKRAVLATDSEANASLASPVVTKLRSSGETQGTVSTRTMLNINKFVVLMQDPAQ